MWERRGANIEGRGEATLADCVRATLRQNPDRVIVGEIRGVEVVDMLRAMSQGNDGSMSSIHADSSKGAIVRLGMYTAEAGLDEETSNKWIANAVDLIIHLGWVDGVRRVTSVREVLGGRGPPDRHQRDLPTRLRRPGGASTRADDPQRHPGPPGRRRVRTFVPDQSGRVVVSMGVAPRRRAGCRSGFGLWLGITAIRGVRVVPDAHRLVPKAVPAERAVAWLATASVSGVVVGLVTGWPVAGVGAALGVLAGPAALGGTARRQQETATAEAIATWADMIRDTMAGASGLEESLIQTATVAPDRHQPSAGNVRCEAPAPTVRGGLGRSRHRPRPLIGRL